MELPNEALVNYVFPNDAHILWRLMIVLYPFVTGLIAGAFFVSALYHVFKVRAFQPIARFALVVSFCFGLCAGLPLLLHLEQPQRAFNIFFTPTFRSPMSMFGYIYSAYMLLLAVELWLVYREYIILKARETGGFLWRAATLGVTEHTPEAARLDGKLITILAALGIPAALVLHGYVGYIFGSVEAVAWWASSLQPIIFIASAMVSGIAMLLVMYTVIMRRRGQACDLPMVRKLMLCLLAVFLFDYALEWAEVGLAWREDGHHWSVIEPLLFGPLFKSYFIGQMGVFSAAPILLLLVMLRLKPDDRRLLPLANIASILLMLQVLFMRFNVVIGGQLVSKSDRGFVEHHFEWLGREGILAGLVILALPFITYAFLSRFVIPVFDEGTEEPA